MVRLIQGLGANSPSGYDAIYKERKEKGVDPFDVKRWQKLLKYYRGGKLVDIGTLDSLIPAMAKDAYPQAEVWGIDTAEEAIKDMQERYPQVLYAVDDGYKTKFPSNHFDYVVAGEVIEHLDDPPRFIKECMRILKHGGIFALSTPEEEIREIGAIDALRHVHSFSQKEIQDLLSPYGKVIIRIQSSQYFPKYIYSWPTIISFLFKK